MCVCVVWGRVSVNFNQFPHPLFPSSPPPHPLKQIPTPYGDVAIEEFDLAKARELDVIFLAVGGDFSKDYAHKLAEGVRFRFKCRIGIW